MFGRAGIVNQFIDYAFGMQAGRWLYGVQGVWLAQMFAFTPVAFLVDLLAAIPSVIYGLWGVAVLGPEFVQHAPAAEQHAPPAGHAEHRVVRDHRARAQPRDE